jgi:hypothetical protein
LAAKEKKDYEKLWIPPSKKSSESSPFFQRPPVSRLWQQKYSADRSPRLARKILLDFWVLSLSLHQLRVQSSLSATCQILENSQDQDFWDLVDGAKQIYQSPKSTAILWAQA